MPFPTAVTPRFKVFSSGDAELEPTVAAGRDGRFSIEWEATLGAGDIRSYVYQGGTIGADGTGSVSSLGVFTASAEQKPDTAILNNGSHVLVFEQVLGGNRDIYVRIDTKNANGTYTTGASVLVNTTTTGSQFRPEIVALAGGGFVVGWEDSSNATIKLQRYNANGAAQGPEISVAATSTQVNGVFGFDLAALSNGGFALAYQGNGGLTSSKISAFDAAGAPIVTNLDASDQLAGVNHNATSLTQLANGDIVAAWFDGGGTGLNGVRYRLFNASFISLTGDLVLPTMGLIGLVGDTPRLAATLDGRFMVVFSGPVSSSGGVYGQMVNANGVLDGAAVLLSTGNTTTASKPEIETTADGRMVVTWQEASDIYAAIYDPRTVGLNLVGTSGADNYVGTAIGDTVFGGDGDDAIFGENGADLLNGGDGNDQVEGGFNSDTMSGGAGHDRLFAATSAAPDGSTVGDSMYGGSGNDTLTGSGGADTIFGEADDDILYGGVGADRLDGGTGWDTVSYAGAAASVQVVMYNATYNTGEAAGDTFADIQALQGSSNIDTLIGDFLLNAILGGAGGDWIDGTAGNDYLYGEAGDDSIVSRAEAELLDGGDGFDYARYDYATEGVRAYFYDRLQNSGFAAGDLYVSLEGLVGSAFADDLRGDNGVNAIFGQGGNDFLIGLGNVDYMNGGAGFDTFFFTSAFDGGGTGDVIQDFASGVDRIMVDGSQFFLGSPGGTVLESWRFVAGANATLATVQFGYNAAVRELWYDSNGTAAGGRVTLATLQAGATMAAGDIIVI